MANDYYREEKSETTFLEFYSVPIESKERNTFRLLKDQNAYDTWHLSFYLKEIFEYEKILKKKELNVFDLPRKEKNLLMYLLFCSLQEKESIFELGSSTFELIDGMELVKRYLLKNTKFDVFDIDIKEIKFHGFDISDLLNFGARRLHENYLVNTYSKWKDIPIRYDVFYDRAVSSYAFKNVDELVSRINSAQACLMNLYVSKEGTFVSSRLGKPVTYFDLRELIEKSDRKIHHLFGQKSPGPWTVDRDVVEGFFLICTEDVAEQFKKLSQLDPGVQKYFKEKEIELNDAKLLLDN